MFDPYTLRTLINEHGVVVTLRKRLNSAYDQLSGTVVQGNTDYQVKAYYFNNDPSMLPFNQANARYDNVATGEKRVVVSDKLLDGSNTPAIDVTDQIIGDGSTANVTRTTKITSAGDTMCQMLYVSD
jgi:hypothetical protein